jgi:hypothetical protein
LAKRRIRSAPPARKRWNENSRLPFCGRANQVRAGLDTAAAIRFGASRKSSAFAVGGVSSTTRSNCPPVTKSCSASVAANSCDPVTMVVICL